MKWKRQLSIILVLLIFLSTNNLSNAFIINTNNKTESIILKDVPYISQETNFYCTYACPTMIFQYYGFNSSLMEVLFNSGVGYATGYNTTTMKRYLISCIGTCNWKADRKFLGNLYGLSYSEIRLMEYFDSEEKLWDKYWTLIKENLTNNQPVVTIVNPTGLSSVRNAMKNNLDFPDLFWNLLPNWIWHIFPSFYTHMITIVGFNEQNNSICYHDPGTALFGQKQCGIFAWMKITDYRKEMKLLSKVSNLAYSIGSYKNTTNPALINSERFITAYKRNIEKMKGNLSVYDEHVTDKWKADNQGINSFKQYKTHLSQGPTNRVKTINLYKFINTFYFFSFAYKIYNIFDKLYPKLVDLDDYHTQMNYIYQLKIERENVSNYLKETQNLIDNEEIKEICKRDSKYLVYEKENLSYLSESYTNFLKRGALITLPKAFNVADEMINYLTKLISIEEKIISESGY